MSPPLASTSSVWGERASLALWPSLVAVAAFATVVDAIWWVNYAMHEDAPPITSPAEPGLGGRPEPMAKAPVIEVQPAPAAAPAPAPAQVIDKVPAEAPDCPPLFPITFAHNGVVPRFDQAALLALVAWLREHPRSNLVIDGHADSSGSMAMNLAISQRRASTVAKLFMAADLPRERIVRRAFGSYNPLVGAPDKAAENRRVVVSVTEPAGCPTSESP